jgi:hypothetical protein
MVRKYNSLNVLSHEIMEGDYLMSMVHTGARLDAGEKRIIFRSVTFQNLVQNSYNAVTHLWVDFT